MFESGPPIHSSLQPGSQISRHYGRLPPDLRRRVARRLRTSLLSYFDRLVTSNPFQQFVRLSRLGAPALLEVLCMSVGGTGDGGFRRWHRAFAIPDEDVSGCIRRAQAMHDDRVDTAWLHG